MNLNDKINFTSINKESLRIFNSKIMRLYFLLLFLMCLSFTPSYAQDLNLSDCTWKNRLLVLSAAENNSDAIQKQLEILLIDVEELMDRKLIIIHIEPDRYRQIIPEQEQIDNWIRSSQLYERYGKKSSQFEIQLIGLDGGVKMRSANHVSTEFLFSLIDGMPMRRNELKNRGH